MDNSFTSLLEKSKSVLILLPTTPYFDQVAAGLSLYLALQGEKETQISSPSDMTVEFNRLVGVNKISKELGSNNLVIRFTDYKANDIERVSYDIENGQFKLSVIPKKNIKPPNQNQVNISYTGISADTVILIGGANESHFPSISAKELENAQLIHIGTKDVNLGSKKYVSLSRPAASVSEIVYSLIKESNLKIDADTATNLLMGIEEGSNKFADNQVSADTFLYISELMKHGGKRIPASSGQSAANYPEGSIPGNTPANQTNAQSQNQPPSIQQPQATQPIQDQNQTTQTPEAPKEWLQQPKVYKGTSIS